jgi:hypothetical protein
LLLCFVGTDFGAKNNTAYHVPEQACPARGGSIISSRTLHHLSGRKLIIGSPFVLIGIVLTDILYPGHVNTPSQLLSLQWLLLTCMILIGSLLFVIGLPGMYLRQAGSTGVLGLVGFILLFFAILLEGAAFSSVQIIVLPLLAQKAQQLLGGNSLPLSAFLLLLISGPMQIIGTILLGIATMHACVFPRWTGILLLISGIAFLLTIPPLPTPISDIIEVASFITLTLVCIGCRYLLMGQRNEAAEAAPFARASTQGAVESNAPSVTVRKGE